MRTINRLRAWRLFEALMLTANLAIGSIDAATGHVYWVISAVAVLFIAGAMCFQTVIIRRLERSEGSRGSLPVALLRGVTGRRRPDYARIRELEIECELREAESRGTKVSGLGLTSLELIRVEPKVTGRKPKRFDFSEDRAAMRALAETYRERRDH